MGLHSKTAPPQYERPAWTTFFEGDLYRRYQDYMQNKKFSQILSNRLSTQTTTSSLSEFPPKLYSLPAEPGTTNKTNECREKDRRRRRRRTACMVCLLMLLMTVIALAVGLIIHFLFVEDSKEDRISTEVSFSIPGNRSDIKEKLLMADVVEYMNEGPITLTCHIQHARKWKSFSIGRTENGTGRSQPKLSVVVHSSGAVTWNGQSPRLDVHYMTEPSTDEGGTNLTITLTFFEVYCRDAGDYVCELKKLDNMPSSTTHASLHVKGRPSAQLLIIVPEDVLFKERIRVTGAWSAGYPEAWGGLVWDVKTPNENFVRLPGSDTTTYTEVDRDTCEVIIKSVIELGSNNALNGTVVRLSTNEEVVVVANSMPRIVEPVVETIYTVSRVPVSNPT
ncbi:hypothetical protein ScPMuIL_018965 [Solemya velum]